MKETKDKVPGRPPVRIFVNEQEVEMKKRTATGSEIKTAAIAQGVQIQQNFMLMEELPNGTSRKIGDADEVRLRPHMKFTAIAPDDNS
ncbi:MAG: multiubiquitin domain-containing protein [Acidobacteriota bacterium]|nr:MAG: multiubiquitin domain-containing protein [Acidobacteriota bacterium]